MIEDVKLGEHVSIPFPGMVNIYHCEIGDHTFVGPFVEIQRGVIVGRLCKIQSHTFLCGGVTVGDRVTIAHHVVTCNDLFPAIDATPVRLFATVIGDDVIIGSGATLLPVRIGCGAVVGAGAVVTRDVGDWEVVAGNPSMVIARFSGRKERNEYFATRSRDGMQPI
jgi:acetyltransferase-like isoleucine patch superfamily enzyme